jgi:hypothetical protein
VRKALVMGRVLLCGRGGGVACFFDLGIDVGAPLNQALSHSRLIVLRCVVQRCQSLRAGGGRQLKMYRKEGGCVTACACWWASGWDGGGGGSVVILCELM